MEYLAIGYLVGLLTVLIPARILGTRLARQRDHMEIRMERERDMVRSLEVEKAYAAGRNDQAMQDQATLARLQQQVSLLNDENDDLRGQLTTDTIFANRIARRESGTVVLRGAGGRG